MQRNYAYLRVSSADQSLNRQIDAIKGLDIDERDIYMDKQSGKDFNWAEFQALKCSIRAGDTLFIKSLDRFERNKTEILNEWQWLVDNKINIVVLDMPLLDTRKYKNLDGVGELVTNLVLQILSWLAEEERRNIRQRQREGIDAAKLKNMKFGRPKHEIDQSFIDAYSKWRKKEITAVKAMGMCGMKCNTFYRRVREYESRVQQVV